MQTETCCECFFPSTLCTCHPLPFQVPVFPERDFVMFPDAEGGQAWMPPTDSILPNVRPEEPPPQPVLPACDVPIPPMNPLVPEASTELPPRVVVATQEQVAAANKRRTNAIPGRFVCKLCPQNFTAKHNLKNHINSHFQKKTHHCRGCGSSFGTRSSFIRHRRRCRAAPGPT